jgi:ferric-dicitrate binding protein FerR (iron transport regulator)
MRYPLFFMGLGRIAFMGLLMAACHSRQGSTLGEGANYHVGAGNPRIFQLPDGSSMVVMPGTTVATSKAFGKENRDIDVDGEVMLEVSRTGPGKFRVHTRDLVVEVMETPARFHVAASRARPGEEVDLLEGHLRASKAYHSDTDSEPEILAAGEMVMINRDIDLMEKERLSPAELDKVEKKAGN